MPMILNGLPDTFPGVEARNGQMLPAANQHAAEFAWRRCKVQVAGSDAHALASVGTTYTEVPGARTRMSFLPGFAPGYGRLHGESGSYWKLTRDILLLCLEMMREDRWTLLLAPAVALVPAGVAVDYLVRSLILSGAGARPSIFRSPRRMPGCARCRSVRNSRRSAQQRAGHVRRQRFRECAERRYMDLVGSARNAEVRGESP